MKSFLSQMINGKTEGRVEIRSDNKVRWSPVICARGYFFLFDDQEAFAQKEAERVDHPIERTYLDPKKGIRD